MPEHNPETPEADCFGSFNILCFPEFIVFGAHKVGNPDPVENGENKEQDPECRADGTAQNNYNVEKRQSRQDFNDSLHSNVEHAAEISLNGADHNTNGHGEESDQQSKAETDPETVQKPRENVAAAVIRAEQVLPCGRRGRVSGKFQKRFIRPVRNGRKDHPVSGSLVECPAFR